MSDEKVTLRLPCERPGCPRPKSHTLTTRGQAIVGWTHLCCAHADHVMIEAGRTVGGEEAAAGWASWNAAHREQCGTGQHWLRPGAVAA